MPSDYIEQKFVYQGSYDGISIEIDNSGKDSHTEWVYEKDWNHIGNLVAGRAVIKPVSFLTGWRTKYEMKPVPEEDLVRKAIEAGADVIARYNGRRKKFMRKNIRLMFKLSDEVVDKLSKVDGLVKLTLVLDSLE